MARFFLPNAGGDGDGDAPAWRMRALDAVPHCIDADAAGWRLASIDDEALSQVESAVVLPADAESGGLSWILLADREHRLRVNGVGIGAGARVLAHRDELRFEGLPSRSYFSTEARVEVVPFDGPEGARCPRCRLVIESGQPAVQCPSCSVWHHQVPQADVDLPCWTFTSVCAVCRRSTDLDGALAWVPL